MIVVSGVIRVAAASEEAAREAALEVAQAIQKSDDLKKWRVYVADWAEGCAGMGKVPGVKKVMVASSVLGMVSASMRSASRGTV